MAAKLNAKAGDAPEGGRVRLDDWPLLAYSQRLGPEVRLAARPNLTVGQVADDVERLGSAGAVAEHYGLVVRDDRGDESPNVAAIEQALSYVEQHGDGLARPGG